MYKETLAQFQGEKNIFWGNMNTIMEYIQAQKDTTSTSAAHPATVVVTDAIIVTSSVDVVVGTVLQPMVSHPICQSGTSRHVVAYP